MVCHELMPVYAHLSCFKLEASATRPYRVDSFRVDLPLSLFDFGVGWHIPESSKGVIG